MRNKKMQMNKPERSVHTTQIVDWLSEHFNALLGFEILYLVSKGSWHQNPRCFIHWICQHSGKGDWGSEHSVRVTYKKGKLMAHCPVPWPQMSHGFSLTYRTTLHDQIYRHTCTRPSRIVGILSTWTQWLLTDSQWISFYKTEELVFNKLFQWRGKVYIWKITEVTFS